MTNQDDQEQPPAATLGDVLDAVVGSMTTEQFEQLKQRTGHAELPPKQKAAEALARLVKHGNLNADNLTFGQVADTLHERHGRVW
ncbi:hypothetical protein JDV09_15365 [Mycobacterium sp. Y57]|uniref:hypothetical protein n=1 Tax=Mycolicibacterium xanthum TaxID=2796469 RepID=UPI001C85A057|nr:hypothetical protein [Mycolicibacterium xanthum]MBX7433479.1 hypothetical protein [Mycolicibacterium xanthum]